MSLSVEIFDDERDFEADIILKIDYKETKGSASRAFEIAADLIKSLEDMDSVLSQSIHSKIETSLVLEDLQKSSLKIFLKNALKELPDDALKELNAKKVVGHFLVKAKYAAIKWLDSPDDEQHKISDLTEEIARLAKETDVRHLPDYPPPNPIRLAQSLDRLQETKSKFDQGESLVITLGEDEYEVNLDRHWLPSENLEAIEEESSLSNEHDLFLIIRKPDFFGNTKWAFKHGKIALSLYIEDEKWLEDFRKGRFPIKPGDALRVRVRVEHSYDSKGNLINSNEVITKVFDVIEGSGETGGLFDE